jgi:hypothetical protein
VQFPIIGIDFLHQFQLVVDVCAEQLLPRAALAQPVASDVCAVAQEAMPPPAGSSKWSEVLKEFPAVTQPFTVASSPSHGIEHIIETASRPPTAHFWRLGPVRLAAAQSSRRSNQPVSSADLPVTSQVHYTWSGRNAAVGGHAATIAV